MQNYQDLTINELNNLLHEKQNMFNYILNSLNTTYYHLNYCKQRIECFTYNYYDHLNLYYTDFYYQQLLHNYSIINYELTNIQQICVNKEKNIYQLSNNKEENTKIISEIILDIVNDSIIKSVMNLMISKIEKKHCKKMKRKLEKEKKKKEKKAIEKKAIEKRLKEIKKKEIKKINSENNKFIKQILYELIDKNINKKKIKKKKKKKKKIILVFKEEQKEKDNNLLNAYIRQNQKLNLIKNRKIINELLNDLDECSKSIRTIKSYTFYKQNFIETIENKFNKIKESVYNYSRENHNNKNEIITFDKSELNELKDNINSKNIKYNNSLNKFKIIIKLTYNLNDTASLAIKTLKDENKLNKIFLIKSIKLLNEILLDKTTLNRLGNKINNEKKIKIYSIIDGKYLINNLLYDPINYFSMIQISILLQEILGKLEELYKIFCELEVNDDFQFNFLKEIEISDSIIVYKEKLPDNYEKEYLEILENIQSKTMEKINQIYN